MDYADFSENELLDLELKYKNETAVMKLITQVRELEQMLADEGEVEGRLDDALSTVDELRSELESAQQLINEKDEEIERLEAELDKCGADLV